MELLTSFTFINVIMANKYHFGSSELFIEAVSNAASMFGMLLVNRKVSGGYFNPAIGLVQPIFQKMIYEAYDIEQSKTGEVMAKNVVSLNAMWIYILAPLLGGALAGLWKHYNSYILRKLKHFDEQEKGE